MQVGGDVAAFGLADPRRAFLLERPPQAQAHGDAEEPHADERRHDRQEGRPQGGELDLAEHDDREADDDEGGPCRDPWPSRRRSGETLFRRRRTAARPARHPGPRSRRAR